MGTGRRRISLAGRGLAGRVVGSRVLAPEDPGVPAVSGALVVPEDPVVRAALVVPENLVVPAVLAALVVPENPAVPDGPVVPAARVLQESPAVRALAIVLAGVQEPETALVEAAPERDQVAVPLKIKSVTGPRRHDQVLLLTVEDLAAEVVETTLEQAAAEAVKAWEAAE
jgi:hypothetical protein